VLSRPASSPYFGEGIVTGIRFLLNQEAMRSFLQVAVGAE
jgi:hypothetical protein